MIFFRTTSRAIVNMNLHIYFIRRESKLGLTWKSQDYGADTFGRIEKKKLVQYIGDWDSPTCSLPTCIQKDPVNNLAVERSVRCPLFVRATKDSMFPPAASEINLAQTHTNSEDARPSTS